jgi:hypothetical protein
MCYVICFSALQLFHSINCKITQELGSSCAVHCVRCIHYTQNFRRILDWGDWWAFTECRYTWKCHMVRLCVCDNMSTALGDQFVINILCWEQEWTCHVAIVPKILIMVPCIFWNIVLKLFCIFVWNSLKFSPCDSESVSGVNWFWKWKLFCLNHAISWQKSTECYEWHNYWFEISHILKLYMLYKGSFYDEFL